MSVFNGYVALLEDLISFASSMVDSKYARKFHGCKYVCGVWVEQLFPLYHVEHIMAPVCVIFYQLFATYPAVSKLSESLSIVV